MGHYRSEMGYESEDKKEEERRQRQRLRTINKLNEAIEKEGIASVLEELIANDTMFRIKYRG